MAICTVWRIFILSFHILDSKHRISAVWILVACLSVSVMALIPYLTETNLSDETLFRLLTVLRYSSFFVCIFSVYLVITGIIKVIRKPSVLSVMGIFMFLFFAVYGACIIVIDAFIISFTGGNV